PPEEIEIRPFILSLAEAADFIRDREHAEPIVIVPRQGEAQDWQVPGPQTPGLPLDWILLIHRTLPHETTTRDIRLGRPRPHRHRPRQLPSRAQLWRGHPGARSAGACLERSSRASSPHIL